MTADGDILDDLFHSCALRAFLEQAAEEQGWPDCEATKHRAYRYYEEALRLRDQAKRREATPGESVAAKRPAC
jgi:hypothetical protein